MTKWIISGILCLIWIGNFAKADTNENTGETKVSAELTGTDPSNAYIKIYDQLIAEEKPSFEAFQTAVKGFNKLKISGNIGNSRYLTVIDFALSSNQKRFWVIDMEDNRVVYHTYVSHGRKSGDEFATSFSNLPNSNQSSIGFYLTGKTYYGKHGLSLRLDGMEAGFNDMARKRAIVIHGAKYANPDFIKKYGRLGRSLGCPALPVSESKEIIKTIAGKTVMFIYYPDQNYFERSGLAI